MAQSITHSINTAGGGKLIYGSSNYQFPRTWKKVLHKKARRKESHLLHDQITSIRLCNTSHKEIVAAEAAAEKSNKKPSVALFVDSTKWNLFTERPTRVMSMISPWVSFSLFLYHLNKQIVSNVIPCYSYPPKIPPPTLFSLSLARSLLPCFTN